MSEQNMNGLNAHLFEQLDRLANAELKGEDLRNEIDRSKAISSVAKDIIGSAKISLEAQQFVASNMREKKLPQLLSIGPSVTS